MLLRGNDRVANLIVVVPLFLDGIPKPRKVLELYFLGFWLLFNRIRSLEVLDGVLVLIDHN